MPAGVTVVRSRVVSSTLHITMPARDRSSSNSVDASWAWRNVAAIVAALAQHHSVLEPQIFIEHVSNVGSRQPFRRLQAVPNAGIDITYFVKIMSGDDMAHIKDAIIRFNNPDNFAGFLAKVIAELGTSRLPQSLSSARGRAEAAVVREDYLVPKATWIPISDWYECSREGWQSREIECSTGNPKACDITGRIPTRRPCNGSHSLTDSYIGVVIALVAWALVFLAWIFRCWWAVPKLTSGRIQLTFATGEEQEIRFNKWDTMHGSDLKQSAWMARQSLSNFSHGQDVDAMAERVRHRIGEDSHDDAHVLSNKGEEEEENRIREDSHDDAHVLSNKSEEEEDEEENQICEDSHDDTSVLSCEGEEEEENPWSPEDVVVHIVDHVRESQNDLDVWCPDDLLWSPDDNKSLKSPDDESVSDAATKNHKGVDVLGSDTALEAYSSVHELEYFCTTHCQWVTALVVSCSRHPVLPTTPRYDVVIGRHPLWQGQRRTSVDLNCLREPLTGPVSYYCSEQRSWLPAEAAPEAMSQATQNMPSYWVQLLDPPSVIRNVPAVHVTARFYCGCHIEAYLGLDVGWVPGVVLASSPLDEDSHIDVDIESTSCWDALSPRLARPAWLRGLEGLAHSMLVQRLMTQLWCNVTVEIEVWANKEFEPQREETPSTFNDQALEVVTLPAYRVRHSELTV